jgi:hypothetical protein
VNFVTILTHIMGFFVNKGGYLRHLRRNNPLLLLIDKALEFDRLLWLDREFHLTQDQLQLKRQQ